MAEQVSALGADLYQAARMVGSYERHHQIEPGELISKRSVRSACRWAPIGAMISGWRIEHNKCPLTA